MRIKKKLLFVLMIPLVLSTNGFAVVETALKGVSKIQSGLNDSLEEQYGKFESQNTLVENRMLQDLEIVFFIQKRQKLIFSGIKTETLE